MDYGKIGGPMGFTLPPQFTELDRARLQKVIARVAPPMQGEQFHGGAILFRRYPSDDAAVAAVLAIFDEFLQALIRTRTYATADLAMTADQALDAYIVEANQASPSGPQSLDAFAAKVRQELETRPSWHAFQTTVETPPDPLAERQARRRETREAFVLPLLADLEWTPTKWALESGVDPSVTLDYLKGTSTPNVVNRAKITRALADALKRPALRLPN